MELPGTGLGELVDNEDYYSLLNASRDSTQEELKNCYRRLCMVYHPDKHDHSKNKDASAVFGRIKTAYNVLSDPTKRHIYDMYGKKGLEADWEIVERRKTPQEMREEYERIQRLRAQHRLEERTKPTGTFSMTINASSLFDNQFEDDEYYDGQIVLPDITRMSLSQSIEAPLTLSQTATLSGNLISKNGNGSGNVNVSLRKTLSTKSWGEVSIGASDSKEFNFALRGYRSLRSGLFALVHFPVATIINSDMIAVHLPGATCTLGHHLSKNIFGSLELKMGESSSLSTSLVKESPRYLIAGRIQLGIPHSFGECSFTCKFPEKHASTKVSVKAGTFGCVFRYGAEHQLSEHSVVSAQVSIGVPIGVFVRLSLNRGSQSYLVPIVLSDDVNIIAAFYGTVLPLAFYVALQTLIIKPYRKREKERELHENEQSLIDETNRKRKEAADLVEMMKESTGRKIEVEERKMGLVVTEAWYGCFVTDSSSSRLSKLVDVTIPLQNLIEKSTLQLPADITKCGLPGFYDPCPGHDKKLKVSYKFRGGYHQVTIDDKDPLRIPLKSHAIGDGQ